MKIWFRKITQLASSDSDLIMKNILIFLDKQGYDVENQTKRSITFKYNLWAFGSRMDAFKNVDGGKLELNEDRESLLVLNYFINPLFECSAVTITACLGIFKDQHFFIFTGFVIVMFLIRIASVRNAAHNILNNYIRKF